MNEQEKRENVIKGLERCIEKLDTVINKAHGFNCTVCPYFRKCDSSSYLIGLPLMRDALALLKAQEPRMETQGRWERVGSDGIVCCSVCGIPLNKTRVCWPDGGSNYYYIATKYCPRCGARNEKGDCDG